MGGNVFKDIHSESIRKEDIKPTLREFFKELRRIFPGIGVHLEKVSTLGSVGKKDLSGDIDLAVDQDSLKNLKDWGINPVDVETYFNRFKAKARSATKEQLTRRAVLNCIADIISNNSTLISVDTKSTGNGTLFTQFPQFSEEGKTEKYVQCDLMFGNLDWLRFSYYSDSYQGNVKGLHRTQLMLHLFSYKGYTFNHGSGVKEKEIGKVVATNPKQAVDLLSKLYNAPFTEEILQNYFTLQEFLHKHLDEKDLHGIYDIYLKTLDSTRCDIPEDLQEYWIDNQERLGLTGKFLPPTSKLSAFKETLSEGKVISESGSIGADRIPRSAVQPTVDWYIEYILKNFEGYKSAKITGSYNTGVKKDHGDIDLTVWVEGEDVKKIKKDFKEYLESLPDNITVPFRAGKRKGDKAQMFGSIVTCAVPMQGFEGLSVQIDNNIVLSEVEQRFNSSFLDLPAEKQALLMGLVRIILQEENPEKVFARLGIKKLPKLESNQEFEFVLSGTGLTLRKVTLDNFKEVARENVWSSRDWSDVEKLLQNYDLSADFDTLLADVASKLKNPRSRRRVVGIMGSMINIGPGEAGTAKGDGKQRAIDAAKSKLGTLEEEVTEPRGAVALYGGGFKPPHKAHFTNAQKLAEKVDKLIIFIGPKVREGVPITADQSKRIWNIYKKYIHTPVEIRVAEKTPIGDIYSLIGNEELKDTTFIVGIANSAEDLKKVDYLRRNAEKYPNVKVKVLPIIQNKMDEKFSATTLRKSIETIKKGDWIPECLDRDDAKEVIEILTKPLEREALQEELKAGMKKVLNKVGGIKEGFSGTAIAPTSVISSENREKLSTLYQDLRSQLDQDFNIQFNQSHILIKVKYPGEKEQDYSKYSQDDRLYESEEEMKHDFNYAENMAALIKFMKNEGMQIEPLPEIILNKEKQSDGLLDATGNYDPREKKLVVYGNDRHPKDVLRSFSHEMAHHEQNLQNKIGKVSTDQVSDDQSLEELEGDAYRRGNLIFRKWTESLKK